MKFDIFFEKIDTNHYFLSSNNGANIIVSKNEFKYLTEKKLPENLLKKLYSSAMIITEKNKKRYISNYRKLVKNTFHPPTLHIIVLTTKCNHACLYCRATPQPERMIDMNIKTLKKILDFIFSVPSQHITVEFQGGETLISWKMIEEAVYYIEQRNIKEKKEIIISVVTNLSLMDSRKLDFIIKHKIALCTSLDGPQNIHNSNRIYFAANSYKIVTFWLSKIMEIMSKIQKGKKDFLPSALMTTTKLSLKDPCAIIEEYRRLNLGGIFIRPLSPIGYAFSKWDEIGYTPLEFVNFYEKALDYIIEINKKEKFIERNAAIKLRKILFNEDPNYLDLRSPCGAATGQLAYYPDGSIYSCDEGRMIKNSSDFRIGNVFKTKYSQIYSFQRLKKIIYSSVTDIYPKCSRCAFKPYCGVCPAFNHSIKGTLYNLDYSNYWCDIEKGIFKILVKKLLNPQIKKIFIRWFDA